jgi:hypothetical protein
MRPNGPAAGTTAEGATRKGGLCPHQRQRSRCKECGGAGICEHQRQRNLRKECAGISKHKRQRNRCEECGGPSICQHQRRRDRCKECREEADTSMPAGLEELAGAAHAAGKDSGKTMSTSTRARRVFASSFSTGPPGDRGALHYRWNAIATQSIGLVPFQARGVAEEQSRTRGNQSGGITDQPQCRGL